MKLNFIFLAILIFVVSAHAQDNKVFYYNINSKIYLDKIENTKVINFGKFINPLQIDSICNFLRNSDFKVSEITPFIYKITGNFEQIDGFEIISNAQKSGKILYISDMLMYEDSTIQWASSAIIVKINSDADINEIMFQKNIPFVYQKDSGNGEKIYIVELDVSEKNAIEYANILSEAEEVLWAQPSFWRLMNTFNQFYDLQWGLKNTGQYGASGFDIRAEQAWTLSTGTGVKIAVLDEGVDLTHPDLEINLLPGYDATDGAHGGSNGSNGSNISCLNDPHGTACSGIISAIDNDIGIKGIAHNAKVIPIRIAYSVDIGECRDKWISNDTCIVNAINWAWLNGADILSNSWGGGTVSIYINNAINAAVTQGRNGKGCVVVFASGNSTPFYPWVQYPARLDDVIAVGAINPNGGKASFSCYGAELDIVAPGVTIYTTDIQGREGYNTANGTDGDYYHNFTGTSAACPFVAGVAALVLSINPNLTGQQVRSIIESTAQKVRFDLYIYDIEQNRPNGLWHERMGYGLVNAYEAALKASVIPCTLLPIEYGKIITQDTEINTDIEVLGSFSVAYGATLTITSEVKFRDGYIRILPGSKLVIDGGTLTNACGGQMWQGILVHGNPNQPQLPQYQGTVVLKNGAKIENAISAIGPGTNFANGAIINVENAIFNNNLSSIVYHPYIHYDSSGNIVDDVGSFKKCTFIVDNNNFFSENGLTFISHIHLWAVKGVTFGGCTFKNEVNSSGKGIYSIDAGFKIKEECAIPPMNFDCPCPEIHKTPCVFENLTYGIHSNNTGNPYNIIIDQSEFNNNSASVSIKASNNYQLTRNIFNIKYVGLQSENSSGYRIEENIFLGSDAPIDGVGIEMINSGISQNRIFKNNFNALYNGINVKLVNHNSNNSLIGTGLQFLCNDFSENNYDIFAHPNSTIREYQGNYSEGADNIFEHTRYSSLYIDNSQQINYFHSFGNSKVPFNPTRNVTTFVIQGINECASTFCVDIILPPDPDKLTEQDIYKDLLNEYDNLVNEFECGGYAQFLENIEDGELSDKVIEALQLLSKIDKISDTMRQISDNAISTIMQDSMLDTNLLKSWYEIVRTPIAKYALAETHFFSNDYEQADAVLSDLPEMFQFNETDIAEYENYKQFHNIKKSVKLSDRTWAELKDYEIIELQTIAEANTGRSSTMAKGVLCFFYDICYEDDDIIEIKSGETPILRTIKEKLSENDRVIGFVVSENILKVNINDVQKIEIYDITGRIVCTESGKNNVAIGHLPSGVYILKIYTDDAKVESRKFIKK